MTEKRFRVKDVFKFNYSDIGEYIGEYYTDRPLRNDILVQILNDLDDENKQLIAGNNRLVNETAKVVAKHQKKVLELIDEKIKEAPHRKCDCSNCVAEQVLMELKEDVSRFE